MNLEQLLDGIRADGNIDALTDLSNILDCCIDKYGERDSNGVKFQHLLEMAICITVMDRVGNLAQITMYPPIDYESDT